MGTIVFLKPIFIVGLPRSGSTLIESLLSSGDQKIKTYGESNFFNIAILEQIKNTIFDRNFHFFVIITRHNMT